MKSIPQEIRDIASLLALRKHQGYLVGGCVRDMLLGKEPKDWDIATDARPEEIQSMFPEHIYENAFGTVAIKTGSGDERLKIVEVTTFRREGKYTDKRHPDEVVFADTIEEDLARRDFTINALALDTSRDIQGSSSDTNTIIDPFGGRSDLKQKLIRAVGKPEERFGEDALRILRAVRLAAELGFALEVKTREAARLQAGLLEMIAKERIRDEFIKIVMSERAMEGIKLLEDIGLLRFIAHELREGIGCDQNKHHIYTVWEHNLRALDYAAKKNYSLEVRLASLLHDVGKPRTKRGEGSDATFYSHEVVGANMTSVMLDRLRFRKDTVEKVTHLVRHHLFYYNVGEVSAAGVRRFLSRVGVEHVDDLLKVREADRIGSGVPKAVPYKLRHLLFMIESVRRDPISPKMLAVKGEDVMETLGIPPGPRVGHILAVLLDRVLDCPKQNTRETLRLEMQILDKLSDDELMAAAETARNKKGELEEEAEGEIKKKYHVS